MLEVTFKFNMICKVHPEALCDPLISLILLESHFLLMKSSFVDLVTTADEYLLNWFLSIWIFTLFDIIGGIILDLVE